MRARTGGRTARILAVATTAVVTVTAVFGTPAVAGLADPDAVPASAAKTRIPEALHGQGRWIVDRHGHRVKLASVNWSGAETQAFTVGGLDVRPLDELARRVREGGFNSVRLPWSNQLVEENPVVAAQYLAANPALQGKRALDVLDAVVHALDRYGIMVVLDNHRSRADWCCDEAHGDGLWYTRDYPESAWLADWRTMAGRYRRLPNVVAAELRNEIRPDPSLAPGPTTATWGDGNPLTDWRAAAERGGNAVLAANPRLLVVVGGTEYQGNLVDVAAHPVRLSAPDHVVYAAHDYRWFHSDAELADFDAFRAGLDQRWGYLVSARSTITAPVYVSEWGTCTNPNVTEQCHPLDANYLSEIARYLRRNDLDFAYWPFNGTQGTGYNRTYGAPETYGLLAPDWSGYGNREVLRIVQSLQRPIRGPGVRSRRPGQGDA
ncbi:MAG: endoglucanase [Micromonosporaceae bacterium]